MHYRITVGCEDKLQSPYVPRHGHVSACSVIDSYNIGYCNARHQPVNDKLWKQYELKPSKPSTFRREAVDPMKYLHSRVLALRHIVIMLIESLVYCHINYCCRLAWQFFLVILQVQLSYEVFATRKLHQRS